MLLATIGIGQQRYSPVWYLFGEIVVIAYEECILRCKLDSL